MRNESSAESSTNGGIAVDENKAPPIANKMLCSQTENKIKCEKEMNTISSALRK